MSCHSIKFCVSLPLDSMAKLQQALTQCEEVDLIELRLDSFSRFDFYQIRRLTEKPLIITIRVPEEGGHWKGNPAKRLELFQAAIDAEMEYLDVAWQTAEKILPQLEFKSSTRLILSHHAKEKSFEMLSQIFKQMLQINADVYKLVITADNLNDNLTALRLIDFVREQKPKFIILATGEACTLSRLIGALKGNECTFVSFQSAAGTATGQLTLNAAKRRYYLQEKNPKTNLIGLLGYPINQSRGWILHNKLLHKKKQPLDEKKNAHRDFIYVNFPTSDFEDFWSNWQNRVDALSITTPHKEKIVSHLSVKSSTVQLSGVCNTAIKKGGNWWGFNTDIPAIMEILQPYVKRFLKGVLILGTGATARSAVAALKQLRIHPIFITGRNQKRGEYLKEIFDLQFIRREEIDGLQVSAIIQTTPIGMYPHVKDIPPGIEILSKGQVVVDVIYNPLMTQFLKIAQESGCTIISGEEMFYRQAAKQFEIFSGFSVSMDEVRQVWREAQSENLNS